MEASLNIVTALDQSQNKKNFNVENNTTIEPSSIIKNVNVLNKHGDQHLAINMMRVALMKNSGNLEIQKTLAASLESTNEYRESFILRKNLMKQDYTFENVFFFANNLYLQNNDEEAIKYYFEALSIVRTPTLQLFEAYKNIGNILVRQGDFEGAEDYYNKANTINSNSDVLYVNYGTLEVQREDFDKAIFCFRQAVQINPKNDKGWVGLAMVHNHFSDLELAWANVETALDINSGNRTAILLAANWCSRDQKIERGIDLLEKYLAVADYDEDLSFVYVNFCIQLNFYSKATTELLKMNLYNPSNKNIVSIQKQISDFIGS